MPSLSNKFAIYIAIGRLISMIASFIMPLILVRFMSQDDYGIFSQYFILYTALYMILGVGIHSNLFFFYTNSSKELQDKSVTNTILLLCFFSIVSFGLLYIPFVQKLIFGDSELGNYKHLILLGIIMAIPMNIVSPIFTVKKEKCGALFFPGLVAFARIGIIVCAVLQFANLGNIFRYLLYYQAFLLIIIIIYSFQGVKFSVDWNLMKKQLVYSLPFGLAVALQLFLNYFDKITCIQFLTPTEFAIYSVAFMSIPGVNQVYDSLCQVNIVNMTTCYKDGNNNAVLEQYRNFVVQTISFSTPLILVVCVFAKEIINLLFPSNYSGATPYFIIYSLTFIVAMLGAGTILRAVDKTKYSMYAYIITCLIGMPATYLLIRSLGINGAIIGAVINLLLPRFIQLVMEYKILNVTLHDFLPWKKLVSIIALSFFALAPIVAIKMLWSPNILWCMLISCVYVSAIYCIFIRLDIFLMSRERIVGFVGMHKATRFLRHIL